MTDASEVIREGIGLVGSFDQVFLFGSALNQNAECGDIDILLLYKVFTCHMQVELEAFVEHIEELTGLPVDVTALSFAEEQDVGFLSRINSLRIK